MSVYYGTKYRHQTSLLTKMFFKTALRKFYCLLNLIVVKSSEWYTKHEKEMIDNSKKKKTTICLELQKRVNCSKVTRKCKVRYRYKINRNDFVGYRRNAKFFFQFQSSMFGWWCAVFTREINTTIAAKKILHQNRRRCYLKKIARRKEKNLHNLKLGILPVFW